MRVAVLGGSGQVGASLCRRLENEGHEVINIDYLTGYDLTDPMGSYIKELYSADFVYFLAFDVGGSTYLKEYQFNYTFIQNNMKIMQNVFKCLFSFETPFIFSSTQMSNMSHSPYGVLKRVGEFYTNSLNGVNARFWNVYGVEHDPEKTHVITDFINMAKKDKYIICRTNGKEQRQFLHSDDCSKALMALMNNYEGLDKTKFFDITSFQWTSIEAVAHLVAHQFPGTTVQMGREKDEVQGIRNSPNEEILKFWTPTTDIYDGIKSVIGDMS